MRKVHRKTPLLESPFNKVAGFAGSAALIKNTPTQVFFCEICETFKNTYFVEQLQTTACGSCKHSIWACYKVKDIDSTEFFRKMISMDVHVLYLQLY